MYIFTKISYTVEVNLLKITWRRLMSYSIQVETKEGYDLIAYGGDFTTEDVVSFWKKLQMLAENSKNKRILIERQSDTQSDPDAYNVMHISNMIAKSTGPLGVRIAVLLTQNMPHNVRQMFKFGTNLANNQGGIIRLFYAENDAVEWLLA